METKEECGLIYYKVGDEWKLAGRADHPLTKRYLRLLEGKPSCLCGCKTCEEK
jgi:hypothetical protein